MGTLNLCVSNTRLLSGNNCQCLYLFDSDRIKTLFHSHPVADNLPFLLIDIYLFTLSLSEIYTHSFRVL